MPARRSRIGGRGSGTEGQPALAFLLGLAALLRASFVTAAVCSDTPSCLAAIEKSQRQTTSMTADFVQVKHVQLLEEPITSRGKLTFRRPDRIRLDIVEPMRSTVLINGREIHVPGLSEKEKQAMAMAPAATMFAQLGAVFTGATAELQQGFEVTATSEGDAAIEVTLVPRVESWRKVLQRMQIVFTGSELAPHQLRLDDALGDRLEVTLENVQRNVDLPDALFQPPTPGAEPARGSP